MKKIKNWVKRLFTFNNEVIYTSLYRKVDTFRYPIKTPQLLEGHSQLSDERYGIELLTGQSYTRRL